MRESGSHFDLLAKPGSHYSELWKSQHKFADGVPPRRPKHEDKHLHLELFDHRHNGGCCRSGGECKR